MWVFKNIFTFFPKKQSTEMAQVTEIFPYYMYVEFVIWLNSWSQHWHFGLQDADVEPLTLRTCDPKTAS